MTIRDTVRRFAEPIRVIRQPELVRVRGRVRDAGDPIEFTAMVGIQPAGPKDLERLPEGQRTNAAIVLWTAATLSTGDVPGTRPDRVVPCGSIFPGVTFEIQSVEVWPRHNRYLAIKVGQ